MVDEDKLTWDLICSLGLRVQSMSTRPHEAESAGPEERESGISKAGCDALLNHA